MRALAKNKKVFTSLFSKKLAIEYNGRVQAHENIVLGLRLHGVMVSEAELRFR
jgi:hypothetical protein